MIKFTYNGKIYAPSNLEKKLKKLGITMEDIQIISEQPQKSIIQVDYKYKYRLNQNTVLCANTPELMNMLKKWYGIQID